MKENLFLSVTQVVSALNSVMEKAFPVLSFQGEISQISKAASGHIYFTLKDEQSQIACAMWRGHQNSLAFTPDSGMLVLCQGRPNLYNRSGRFQIVVTQMQQAGAGLLQQKFLEIKAKLEQEGFFAPDRKRLLPFLPRGVGVVTSKSGAVIHDIMAKVTERFASIPVYLVDVRVQGPSAAEEIAEAIKYLGGSGLVDVIIVGRGGGSLEDLWAFNEEIVVRAIFASQVAIVSAVGHETDVTLADLVADKRAPTPTAAAEMVVPKRSDLVERLMLLRQRLFDLGRWFWPYGQSVDQVSLRLQRAGLGVHSAMRLKLETAETRLALLEPSRVIALLFSRLRYLVDRLVGVGQQRVLLQQRQLDDLEGSLKLLLSGDKIRLMRGNLENLLNRLDRAERSLCAVSTQRLNGYAVRLGDISPIRVLERGYAVVESGGSLVRSGKLLSRGQELKVSFAADAVVARVEKSVDVAWRVLDGEEK